ncbi:hypothetical protein B0H15DRAFT_785685 [Mycena belliarum]|uniref:Uncharacterized protein n=1 Tax=Mycena belliarum TaxID=1033014 RepID=A0AAD6TZ09_9AGAR|nr:hypothetical protein B0H15DRAFT_785685 [Mycena belliae]
MSLDLLRNVRPGGAYPPEALLRCRCLTVSVELGPFDGRVGALIDLGPTQHLITSNTTYIPHPPPIHAHAVSIRTDMRYGPDDPTQYPQQYSDYYCHLACIPRRPARPDLAVMWWNPTPETFQRSLSPITNNLGKLALGPFTRLLDAANTTIHAYREYRATVPTDKLSPLFPQISETLILALERIQSLPSTYEQMVFEVTSVQRSTLELEALLQYMKIYQPRMNDVATPPDPPGVSSLTACMGAFTSDPRVVQRFFKARLPFWFIRPAHAFAEEVILSVVHVLPIPVALDLPIAPGRVPVYTGANTETKIKSMALATRHLAWYTDPFTSHRYEPCKPYPAPLQTQLDTHVLNPRPCPSRGQGFRLSAYRYADDSSSSRTYLVSFVPRLGHGQRPPQGAPAWTPPLKPEGRDKFVPFESPDMPLPIAAWASALTAVDRSRPPKSTSALDRKYLLPEPAALVSSQNEQKRRRMVHHWTLLRDVFFALIGDPHHPPLVLTSQEWRDILEGHVTPRADEHSRRGKRSRSLATLIAPVLAASNQDGLRGYPPPKDSLLPHYTTAEIQQILWDLAETNFRWELQTLDLRASAARQPRPHLIRRCFAGGSVLDVDPALARQGLASKSLPDRHRYNMRLATLMLDWQRTSAHRPPLITRTSLDRPLWSSTEMHDLEFQVATHYTQSFYDLMGRAPVIPMRLD